MPESPLRNARPTGASSRATCRRRTRALERSPVGAVGLAVVVGAGTMVGAGPAAGALLRVPLEQAVAASTIRAASAPGPHRRDAEDWVRIATFSPHAGGCVA